MKSQNISNHYFELASSWADDIYTSAIISRNRYKYAFMIAMLLACLLVVAILVLLPLQHLQPLLIHHYQDGRVIVDPIKQPYRPINQAQVESEIVRYVINRESYDATSYHIQYSLVNLLSNREVASQYIAEQAASNKQAPINHLGNKGYRTVHIDNVIFLDSTSQKIDHAKDNPAHHNLAQINFSVIDQFKNSARKKVKAYTALIAWDYRGIPSDPADRWQDWDGFTVTRYSVVQRNL